MADAPKIPPAEDLPLAPNGEVKALDRLGNKITVAKDRVGELYGMGGRVARKDEVAAAQLQKEYDEQSTAQKAGAVASVALPLPLQMLVRGSGAASLTPEFEAYRAGASQAMTLGAEALATKGIVSAVAGEHAGAAFGRRQLDLKEAHGDAYTAGNVAGFVGGAVASGGTGLAGAGPAGLVTGAGNVAEGLAARGLAGLAAKGAMGRALATGGELAARGAVEGALYSAADRVTEDMLGNHEVVADKLWAAVGSGILGGAVGGAVLGGAGSLLKSGASAAIGAGRRGIASLASKAEEVVAARAGAATDEATTLVSKAAAGADDVTKAGASKFDDVLRRQANNAAVDALYAEKGAVTKVTERLGKDGRNDLGEWVNRNILKGEDGEGAMAALSRGVREGRADDMLEKIAPKKAEIGAAIGEKIAATPAKVDVAELTKRADDIYGAMRADPVRIQGADAFKARVDSAFEAFANGGKVTDNAMNLADMYYARAGLEKQAFELTKGSAAHGALKEWLREVDSLLVDKLDDAAKVMGKTGEKEGLLALKREYQLASAAETLAEKGTARIHGNNPFGIREGIGAAVGLATGNPLMGMATGILGKVARERGSAATATLLSKMADMGALSNVVRSVDEAAGKAAHGLLQPAKAGPYRAATSTPARVRAKEASQRVAEIQANPQAYVDRVAKQTEGMSATAPNLAGGLSKRMTDSAAFLASKLPSRPDPDPFDPHPAAKMNAAQAVQFARYVDYVERPMRFFEEAQRGDVTYEGVEVAKALMPAAFAEMQMRVAEGLADMLSRGQSVPIRQRERLGLLMDIPAVPSQRPEHMKLLQRNVLNSEDAAGKVESPQHTAPKRPIPNPSGPQRSALDRLEGGGIGRR